MPVSSVDPSSILSCIIVTTVWFVVVGRELVNRFTSVVMEIKSFENKNFKEREKKCDLSVQLFS